MTFSEELTILVFERELYNLKISSLDKSSHFETKEAISSILFSNPNAFQTSACFSTNCFSA